MSSNLSEGQFGWQSRTGARYQMHHEPTSITARTPAGEMAGYLTWSPSTSEVGNINVREPFQRQGVATEMWRRARDIDPEIRHSDRLSDDAKAWISGMGAKGRE